MSSTARIAPRALPNPKMLRAISMFTMNALRLAPSFAKYLALLLLVLNAGSWPLVWHLRVFAPVFKLRAQHRLLKIRHAFSSKKQRELALDRWYESKMPIGEHPFRKVLTYRSWASLDDSDFNLHMSNSSYAKALDAARFRLALDTFPSIFRAGGWVPLAATHYHFIREIPMLSKYEIRASIGAWDEKWIWFIQRFVTHPKKGKKSAKSRTAAEVKPESMPAESFTASLKTPGSALLTPGLTSGQATPSPEDVAKALLASAAAALEEEDGAILHTISVSQCCFKQGRITVPPAIVLASNGFYAPPPSSPSFPSTSSSTSSSPTTTNPTTPPHWPHVRALASTPAGGSMRALRDFYAGGWRAVPVAERWWEDAFAGLEGELRERAGRAVEKNKSARLPEN
ncbi:hypothetical protein B0H10DRAFT_2180932 [Mycena sp. CBHHK59/15]|nr:hypothetical protein B0H10DRAFT_2180932 [Mycena sp. CBHHK59/15]